MIAAQSIRMTMVSIMLLWVLTFTLFAWQDGWKTVLGAFNPSVSNPLLERNSLLELVWQHLHMVGVALSFVLFIGLPVAVLSTRRIGRAFLPLVSNIVTVGQTFPPTAVLFLMLPIFGFGAPAALIALCLYGLLPTVRGALMGLESVPKDVLEAGIGCGMNSSQCFWRLELPLALSAILAGVRTSVILVIATATIAPLVGTGGLGVPIISGLSNDNLALVLEGAIPVAMLALLSDFSLRTLERVFMPWQHHSENRS